MLCSITTTKQWYLCTNIRRPRYLLEILIFSFLPGSFGLLDTLYPFHHSREVSVACFRASNKGSIPLWMVCVIVVGGVQQQH